MRIDYALLNYHDFPLKNLKTILFSVDKSIDFKKKTVIIKIDAVR